MRLLLAKHPRRLEARNPLIIEELLALVHAGRVAAVETMIGMLRDLHDHGRTSRYLRNMTGTPVWELKSQSRGGEKGGSRIYLFLTAQDEAGIVNCEVKDDKTCQRAED